MTARLVVGWPPWPLPCRRDPQFRLNRPAAHLVAPTARHYTGPPSPSLYHKIIPLNSPYLPSTLLTHVTMGKVDKKSAPKAAKATKEPKAKKAAPVSAVPR